MKLYRIFIAHRHPRVKIVSFKLIHGLPKTIQIWFKFPEPVFQRDFRPDASGVGSLFGANLNIFWDTEMSSNDASFTFRTLQSDNFSDIASQTTQNRTLSKSTYQNMSGHPNRPSERRERGLQNRKHTTRKITQVFVPVGPSKKKKNYMSTRSVN